MAQAKGILPRREEREVLYKNPQTCGYFVGVKLDPGIDRPRAEAWLASVTGLIDDLVERLPPEGGEREGAKGHRSCRWVRSEVLRNGRRAEVRPGR